MNYFKILVTIAVSLFTANVSSNPWNNNTREHLFGYADRNWVDASILDEGFRWRNSFNFTIDGQNISSENWLFNRVVDVDNDTFQHCNYFARGEVFCSDKKTRSSSPNLIHSHLSKIAHKIKQDNNCVSASVAAVTIVVDSGEEYYAFSEMINQEGKPYVATTTGEKSQDIVAHISDSSTQIKQNINNIVDCNIPNGSYNRIYSCTEGKILSKLTDNKLSIFKKTIIHLLDRAQQILPLSNLNYDSIRLVVLHIGTTMDPCAICTRCLVGISKRINENVDSYLRSTEQGSPTGRMDNTKFLIEVSSNGHYNGGNKKINYSWNKDTWNKDTWNQYNRHNEPNCSHTECAGHDRGETSSINISLNFSSPTSDLAKPCDTSLNWELRKTFPPYVVFGRADPKTQSVVPAPAYNQSKNRWHLHECKNNLPLVG